jgi:hypothetical protein
VKRETMTRAMKGRGDNQERKKERKKEKQIRETKVHAQTANKQ